MFSESEILSEPISAKTSNCHFFFERSDDGDGYKLSLYIYDGFGDIESFNTGDGIVGYVCIKSRGGNGSVDFAVTLPIKKFHNYAYTDSKFAIMHLQVVKNIENYSESLDEKNGKAGNLHIEFLTDTRRDSGSAARKRGITKHIGVIYCVLDI